MNRFKCICHLRIISLGVIAFLEILGLCSFDKNSKLNNLVCRLHIIHIGEIAFSEMKLGLCIIFLNIKINYKLIEAFFVVLHIQVGNNDKWKKPLNTGRYHLLSRLLFINRVPIYLFKGEL